MIPYRTLLDCRSVFRWPITMDGARNPCLIVKLLEYLHELGVRSTSDTSEILILWGGIRMPGTWGIPGSIRAPITDFRIQFSDFLEVVFTAKKITILKGYFSKKARLIAIWSCNLTAFWGSLFLTHISGRFLRETASNALLLPSIAITSENLGVLWGFIRFFLGLIIILVWREVCVEHLPENNFHIFFARLKIFNDFFMSRQNFLELLKKPWAHTKLRIVILKFLIELRFFFK